MLIIPTMQCKSLIDKHIILTVSFRVNTWILQHCIAAYICPTRLSTCKHSIKQLHGLMLCYEGKLLAVVGCVTPYFYHFSAY